MPKAKRSNPIQSNSRSHFPPRLLAFQSPNDSHFTSLGEEIKQNKKGKKLGKGCLEGGERWMWRRKRRGVVWISWYPPSMPALSSSKNSSSLATVTLQFFSCYHSFIQLQFTCLSLSLSRSSVSGHGHHWSIRCWHVCEDAGIPDAINQGQTATRGWSNTQGQSISLSLSVRVSDHLHLCL